MTTLRQRVADLVGRAHRTIRVHVTKKSYHGKLRIRLAEVRDMSADGGERADDIVNPSVRVGP